MNPLHLLGVHRAGATEVEAYYHRLAKQVHLVVRDLNVCGSTHRAQIASDERKAPAVVQKALADLNKEINHESNTYPNPTPAGNGAQSRNAGARPSRRPANHHGTTFIRIR